MAFLLSLCVNYLWNDIAGTIVFGNGFDADYANQTK